MKTPLIFLTGISVGYLLAPYANDTVCSVQKEQVRARLSACLDIAVQATETAQRCSETLLQGLGLSECKNFCEEE